MRYQAIPNTGISCSAICLGTGFFGLRPDRDGSFRLLDRFVELGGTFLDTAHVYSDWVPGERGRSEKTLGEWMRTRGARGQVILATKGGHPEPGSRVPRLAPAQVLADLEESLDRLQTDRVGIYYLHRDNPKVPVEDILGPLADPMRRGLIRALGCSNWTADRVRRANEWAAANGVPGFDINQVGWSLADLTPGALPDPTLVFMDDALLRFHRDSGMAVAAYSSQANGFFGGEYGRGVLADRPSAAQVRKRYYNETNFRRLERAKDLARRKGCSPNQIALAYIMSQPFPGFPLVGCRDLAQLEDSCGAGDIVLEREDLAFLLAP